jgi:hypothetical protein
MISMLKGIAYLVMPADVVSMPVNRGRVNFQRNQHSAINKVALTEFTDDPQS